MPALEAQVPGHSTNEQCRSYRVGKLPSRNPRMRSCDLRSAYGYEAGARIRRIVMHQVSDIKPSLLLSEGKLCQEVIHTRISAVERFEIRNILST